MTRRTSARDALRRIQRALTRLNEIGVRPEAAAQARAVTILRELATIPAAVLIANNRGRYVEANQRATRLTGYTRRELLNMSIWDLTPLQRQGLGQHLWREFLARGRMSGTYQIRHRDGRIMSVRYFAAAHVLPGLHLSALVRSARRRRKVAGLLRQPQ